jgi:anti-anti-sigma regulatory factor
MFSKEKIYPLKGRFGTFLWGRHLAIALRDEILKDMPKQAVLDFEGVTFVTRAFADELMKVERLLASKGVQVLKQHPDPEVTAMFEHVAARVAR